MHAYSDDINHAFAFAAKYRAPYIPAAGAMTFMAHPANVAVILARHGADEVTLVAAILHHVIEATPARLQAGIGVKIEDKFGVGVRLLAEEACESWEAPRGETRTWSQRKRARLPRLLYMSPRAIDICCADDIHECGTALAVAERLGIEYLTAHALPARAADLGCYQDIFDMLDRRDDWPSHGLRAELHALAERLERALATA